MMRKLMLLAAALGTLALADGALGWRWAINTPVGPIAPEPVLLLVSFVAGMEGGRFALVFAWTAGALWDLAAGTGGLGPGIAGALAAACAILAARRVLFSAGPVLEPLLAGAAVAAGSFAVGLGHLAAGRGAPISLMGMRALWIGLYSMAAAPLVFWALRRSARALAGRGPGGAALREWERTSRLHRTPCGDVLDHMGERSGISTAA